MCNAITPAEPHGCVLKKHIRSYMLDPKQMPLHCLAPLIPCLYPLYSILAMQLPPPSACSVPAVHSDMCILRVRRTHLAQDALEEVARQVSG
jgi:hypothetical protein